MAAAATTAAPIEVFASNKAWLGAHEGLNKVRSDTSRPNSDIIPIEPMDNAAVYALLHAKLGDEDDKADEDGNIVELAATLDHMPASEQIPTVSVHDGFRDDILMLQDHLFVTAAIDETGFEIYGLVQLAMHTWL